MVLPYFELIESSSRSATFKRLFYGAFRSCYTRRHALNLLQNGTLNGDMLTHYSPFRMAYEIERFGEERWRANQ